MNKRGNISVAFVFFGLCKILVVVGCCRPIDRTPLEQPIHPKSPEYEIENAEFHRDDGHNYESLKFAEPDRFKYTLSTDIGPIIYADGKYKLDGATLRIMPTTIIPDVAKIITEYTVTTWGERLYLISAVQLETLCVNIDDDSAYLLRNGDENMQIFGVPDACN